MKSDILRKRFLEYFKQRQHKIVESDFLVPKDDPTVLFTPAGMNQFKDDFLNPRLGLKRAASCQRCLRTDDLEKVGKTSGHHTFFEMLGNFSFGDYFKQEAIGFAWEFLTEELKIDREKLWVSVYRDDEESYKIWLNQIKITKNKIIKLGDKENFWPSQAKEKGPNGPCGPCSEIFFDQGQAVGCKRPHCSPACDCERFIEVWNLVFTQFNRKDSGVLEPLPNKNIDTGMGLKRLAAVMQSVDNNFKTDLFTPLTREIIRNLKDYHDENKGLVYTLADHLRAITFAVYDGVMPSNESRGYVIRKLIRKSVLHLRALGIVKPLLYKLVPVLAQIMKEPYPELTSRRENIAEIILSEEKNFNATLDSSGAILKERFKDPVFKMDPVGTGAAVFNLYDTYGIPVELSMDYLKGEGFKGLDRIKDVFKEKLKEQKLRSKSKSPISVNVFGIKGLNLNLEKTEVIDNDYKKYNCKAKIVGIIKDNKETDLIKINDQAKIILDKTVFYPESGGQVGDKGKLTKGNNIFRVLDTKKIDNAIVHIGKVEKGSFKESDTLVAQIDIKRRMNISKNHTATHLLQAALRQVLGPHVQQQGSLVTEEKLRFDFTHFKDIKKEELDQIESLVNDYILNSHALNAKEMSFAEAKKTGALAFFGEKYTDRVRVVTIGDFSKELCGGAHLESTSQIGLFKIISESSVASGVRRIEAQTGDYAKEAIQKQAQAQEAQERLKKKRELEKQEQMDKLEIIKKNIAIFFSQQKKVQGLQAATIKDINVITYNIEGADMEILSKAVDLIKQKSPDKTLILTGTVCNGQVRLAMGNTPDLKARLDSSKLIQEIASEVGGSGGGRKDFAQAGGNQPENLKKALEKIKTLL